MHISKLFVIFKNVVNVLNPLKTSPEYILRLGSMEMCVNLQQLKINILKQKINLRVFLIHLGNKIKINFKQLGKVQHQHW